VLYIPYHLGAVGLIAGGGENGVDGSGCAARLTQTDGEAYEWSLDVIAAESAELTLCGTTSAEIVLSGPIAPETTDGTDGYDRFAHRLDLAETALVTGEQVVGHFAAQDASGQAVCAMDAALVP
jgi:hypothetical protein